jgi:AcrR family transcriptional regulator
VTTAPVTDGRNARSQRTRLAVLDALLALVREGNPRPTAREIAARAGCSLRSVYVHFDDLDDLFLAAAHRQLELVSGMLVSVPDRGPLRDRAEVLMRMRGRIYEATAPVRRAAEMNARASATLTTFLDTIRAAARLETERIFAAELDAFEGDARARRLAALDTVTGGLAWQEMRTAGRLDVPATRKAVIEAIIALLDTGRREPRQ